jgi:type III pantothenate kinase
MRVLLAVDVGNSQTKLGWFEDEYLRRQTQLATGSRPASAAVSEFLPKAVARPAAAVMSSVAPAITDEWRTALRSAVDAEPLVVQGDSEIGIRNHYVAPQSLGPDRLVGALAARELYGAPVIAVSLGTATVVNVVSRQGEFLGGAIAPGLEASLAALTEKAARLFPVEFEVAPRAIATDTRGAMIAGAFFGAVGQVKELLARSRGEMGEDAPAVLTGGWAELVAPELSNIAGVEPALTLIGLRLAWEHVSNSV